MIKSKISPLPILLQTLLILTPLVLFPFISPEILKMHFFSLLILILLFFSLLNIAKTEKLYLSKSWVSVWIGFWFFLLFFSSLVNRSSLKVFSSFHLFLLYLGVYLIASTYTEDSHQEKRLIVTLIMVGTMVSLYALIQYSLHFPLPWKYNFKGGVFSTLGNPNRLAGYLILILPFCLDSLYREKRVKVKVGLLVILLILLGGLLLTRTEGAFLATLISILMFLFLVNRKKFSRWNRANKLILLLFIVTFVFTVIPLIFKSLPEYSINWRLFIWKTSLSMVKEKPFFGWGIGGLERNYPLFQQATRLSMKEASSPFTQETHAHNDYLQILVENGVVGLGLFLGIFVAFFREQLFCKRENLDIPLVCSITAFLTFSLTSFPLYMVNPALVLWVFLGMHSSQMGSSKGYIQLSINLSRNIWRFICSSFIIIAGIFIFFATRLVYADYLYHMGNLYAERGMYSLAESYYKKSLSFNPEEAQIYYSLGKLSFEQGRILDSQRMFETALRLGLNHEKIHLGLASTYKKMGLDEKAKWHYLKAKSLKGEL